MQTRVLANTLLPSRWPPYMSLVALVSGRDANPCCSSALINDQRFAPPEYAHESFSHVSPPTSPGSGITLNVQRGLPVRTSNACTLPGACSLFWGLSEIAPSPTPTITTSRQTCAAPVHE